MRKIFILLCFMFPLFVQSQVVSCSKTELKRTKNDRWERVNYKLRIYEFADSNILREIMHILSFDTQADSIHTTSQKVTFIMNMSFKQCYQDTIICRVLYYDLPYMLEDLKGCCIIAGYYVQISGIVPWFLIPTKNTASFSYLSHKISLYNQGEKRYEIEDMLDDRAPQWKIEYHGNKVRLISHIPVPVDCNIKRQ